MEGDKKETFELTFNKWYKQFIEEEKKFNEEIIKAKQFREEKIKNARKEALEAIRNYELELKDIINLEKEKINVNKSSSDENDKKFKQELQMIQNDYKQNKDKVIDFLIDNVLFVQLEIPQNIKGRNFTSISSKKKK